jgi:hypothetical protein
MKTTLINSHNRTDVSEAHGSMSDGDDLGRISERDLTFTHLG